MNTHTDNEPVYTSITTDSTGKVIGSRSVTESGKVVKEWSEQRSECQIGPVGGHSARQWCSVHKSYANEPWSPDALCPR